MPDQAHWHLHGSMSLLHIPELESLGGVQAFFTGRPGGVSEKWPSGLNWSYFVDDRPDAVRENRRQTLAAVGLSPEQGVMAGLVHGNRVVAVTGTEAGGPGEVRVVTDCDALITDRERTALIVTAADCVPVFLYDPVRRAIGCVHAGWRGTVARIASETVRAMVSAYGCRPDEIRAAVGPSIGPCCYEVGELVLAPLRSAYGETAQQLLKPGKGPGQFLLDLWEANRQDLLSAGVRSVAVSGWCTACHVDILFSHRAEQGSAGRGAAIIAMV